MERNRKPEREVEIDRERERRGRKTGEKKMPERDAI